MKLPPGDTFREVCTDVVLRFKGQDAYKGRDGALKAFKRRAPDYDSSIYATVFDDACDIYDLAVVAIQLFPADREKNSKFAEFEDIDFEKCMDHLESIFPDFDEAVKIHILNWVIFWHYLK